MLKHDVLNPPSWMHDIDGEFMAPDLDLKDEKCLTQEQWAYWWACWDYRTSSRTSGKHGVKFMHTSGDPTQQRWVDAIDALIEIGRIDASDRQTALRSEWIKNFRCAVCGSSSGFIRRDKAKAGSKQYDAGQVRVTCSGGKCRTRDVLGVLGIETMGDPADLVWVDEANAPETGQRVGQSEPGQDGTHGSPEAEASESSWRPVDIADTVDGLVAGTLTRLKPTLGRLQGANDDEGALFYAGRVNGLAGESGAGKSWSALASSAQEINAGCAVVYVDLEDDAAGIVGRLLDMGVDGEAIKALFHYINPGERLDLVAWSQLSDLLSEYMPTLVVVDSTGEGLALEGANPNADEEVARWFRLLPRRAARHEAKPAVLVLDHVTKTEDNGLWPIGSQRKRAAIDGAQYMQRTVKSFSKDAPGTAKIVCAKDRHGTWRIGQHVADLAVTPDGTRVDVELKATADSGQSGTFRPTVLMERVSRYLETHPGAADRTKRQIRNSVSGKEAAIVQAAEVLVAEGYVSTSEGPRGATIYTIDRPYREADDIGGTSQVPNEALSMTGAGAFLEKGTGHQSHRPVPGTSRAPEGTTSTSDLENGHRQIEEHNRLAREYHQGRAS